MEGEGVVHDQYVQAAEVWLQSLQRQGVTRLLAFGVEVGDDHQLDIRRRGEGAATSGQDGHRIAEGAQAGGLLVEHGLDAADHGRTRVVQQPDPRAHPYWMTGGSSMMTARSSGFSITSTSGRPPLYETLKESRPVPIRIPRTSTFFTM